jgi:enamine deaminase RidA (YjgF/YER057c/UK114 family)
MAVYMEKTENHKARGYSPAVITEGGRIVWLAGQTALRDADGNDITGNFEAQVKTVFSLIDATLKKAGGSLANMVTMTVYHHRSASRRPLRRNAQGLFPRWQLSGERADHALALRAVGHADRDSGRGGDWRLSAWTRVVKFAGIEAE